MTQKISSEFKQQLVNDVMDNLKKDYPNLTPEKLSQLKDYDTNFILDFYLLSFNHFPDTCYYSLVKYTAYFLICDLMYCDNINVPKLITSI